MVYSVGISLSDLAWANIRRDTKRLRYDNRGNGDLNSIGGTNAYLAALLKANPTPNDWVDTRPDYLQEEDAPRLASPQPKLPMWSLYDSREDYRRGRLLNRANWDTNLQPPLLTLAHHFLISSSLKERSRASAALEAIGMEYLSPTHPCPQNPQPPKKYYGIFDRHRSRRQSSLQQQFELTF
jgi:hypothetical protein